MKHASIAALFAALALPLAAHAGWLPTTAGTYSFADPDNWQDGIVSGLFGDKLTSKVTLNLTFDRDWTFGKNGLSFEHPGEVTFILRGDGTDRTATFASDMAWAPPATKGSLVFGSATAGQHLDIDLGGGTRTLYSTFPMSFYNTLSNGDLMLEGTANPFGFYGASALAGTGTITLRKSAGNTAMPILRIGEESGSDAGRRIASTLRLEAGAVQFYARKYGDGAEDSFGTVQLASAPKTDPSDYQGGYPVFSFRSSNKPLTVRIGTFERVHDTLLDITANNTALLGSATEVNAVRLLVDNGVETVGGSAGTTSCAIVPWVRIAETGFAVYDAANGFRTLAADTERRTFSEAFTDELETEGENVYIAPDISKVEFTGQRTVVNSLATGYATVAQEVVATNGTLVVASGAIMLDSNQRVYLRANLDFGGRRGYFTNRPGKYSELHGSVAGSSGITFGSIPLVDKNKQPVPTTYPGQGSLSVYSTGTFTGDVSIIGNIWLQSDTFLPSGNRTGDTVVDGNLRIGNAPAFTMNGLRGRGTITLNNSYNSSIVVGDNDSDADFEGNINRTGGTLAFRKIGEGTQRMGGSITLNSTLSVENGTLLLDGEVTGTSPSVASGAALGGNGTIAGGVTFAEGSTFAVKIADNTIPCLTVSGAVTGSPAVEVSAEGRVSDDLSGCILRAGSALQGTFTCATKGYKLELRENDTELWLNKIPVALLIVVK